MKSFLIIAIVVSSVFAGGDYNYNYEGGPASWNYIPGSNCGGLNQSPINFNSSTDRLSKPDALNTFNIDKFTVTNTGHTIEIIDLSSSRNNIYFNSMTYILQKIHFHTPSEHHIDGKHYDAEAHFVFQTQDQSKTSVIGVLFSVNAGGFSRFLDQVQYLFPPKGQTWPALNYYVLDIPSIFASFFKTPNWAYRYSGSLTTPLCNGDVTWWVVSKAMPISVNQLNILRDNIGYNSRPTQPRIRPLV